MMELMDSFETAMEKLHNARKAATAAWSADFTEQGKGGGKGQGPEAKGKSKGRDAQGAQAA